MEQLSFDDLAAPQPMSSAPMALGNRGYKCPPGCSCGRHSGLNLMRYQQTGKKRCTKCAETKPLSGFDVHHEGKAGTVYHARCKPCRRDDARENVRRGVLARAYGMTLEQYDTLFAKQCGMCAICGKPESALRIRGTRPLSVDHDHVTGRIRGLLCSNCNRALGLLGDDIEILKRAIYYLLKGSG